MPRQVKDLTGQRFGRLVVLERSFDVPERHWRSEDARFNRTRWRCACDCGNVIRVDGQSLKRGKTRSCGCWNAQLSSLRRRGLSPEQVRAEAPL